jgi:hypothetical protein
VTKTSGRCGWAAVADGPQQRGRGLMAAATAATLPLSMQEVVYHPTWRGAQHGRAAQATTATVRSLWCPSPARCPRARPNQGFAARLRPSDVVYNGLKQQLYPPAPDTDSPLERAIASSTFCRASALPCPAIPVHRSAPPPLPLAPPHRSERWHRHARGAPGP